MRPEYINTNKAPKFANLSQCTRLGDILFLGGVVGERGEDVLEGMEAQARMCFENIKYILEAANSDLEHIASTNCIISVDASEEDEATFNKVWREVFPVEATRPARCCYRAVLQDDYLIEIVNTVAGVKK